MKIETKIAEICGRENITADIAVVDNYKIICDFTYGVPRNTLFQVASISKPFFAALVMRLCDAGREIDGGLLDLLRHRGGANVDGFDGYNSGDKIPSNAEILRGKGNSPTVKISTNKRYKYSGGGYQIAQEIITQKFGDFCDLMRAWIFDPLKIKHWGYFTSYPNDVMVASKDYKIYPEFAAAGLHITARGVADFGIAIMRSLSRDGFLSTQSAHLMTDKFASPHAVGFRATEKSFWHGGVNNEFFSHVIFSKNGRGVVILTASNNEKVFTKIEQTVRAELNWQDFEINEFSL